MTATPEPTREAPSCGYASADGRLVIEFNRAHLRSDLDEAKATSKAERLTLSAGVYRVTLVSYDEHYEKQGEVQEMESYLVQLVDRADHVVWASAALPDLPDGKEHNRMEAVVDEGVRLGEEVAEMVSRTVAFHAAYPDSSSSNSIRPICAVFEMIGTPEN